jgi:hypothetical protein
MCVVSIILQFNDEREGGRKGGGNCNREGLLHLKYK